MNWKEYNKFRTNLTFKEVRFFLQLEANRKYLQGEYMFITRHTVLGRWREIKLKMFVDGRNYNTSNENISIKHDARGFIF